MTIEVDVQIACDDETAPDTSLIRSWIIRAIEASGAADVSEVSVRIVNAEEMRALNKQYRGKDKATNVLSFTAGKVADLPADVPVVLGDIVVCAGVVHDEAVEQRKTLVDHWAHILVHGALHLLGFDHETDTQAAEMEALETRILADYGLTDPYRVAGET